MLIINSEYDSWSIMYTLGIKCLTTGASGYTLAKCSHEEIDYIEAYHVKYDSLRNEILSYSKNSIWSISCSHHGYAYDDRFYDNPLEKVPASTGITVR